MLAQFIPLNLFGFYLTGMKCLSCGMLAQLNLHLIFNRGEAYSSGTTPISPG